MQPQQPAPWQQPHPPAWTPPPAPVRQGTPTWLALVLITLGGVAFMDTIVLVRLVDVLGGVTALQGLFR